MARQPSVGWACGCNWLVSAVFWSCVENKLWFSWPFSKRNMKCTCTLGSRTPATFSESAELSCACPSFRREKFTEPTRYDHLNNVVLWIPTESNGQRMCETRVGKFQKWHEVFWVKFYRTSMLHSNILIFVLREKGGDTKKRRKEEEIEKGGDTKKRMKVEEIEKGDCRPPTRKVFNLALERYSSEANLFLFKYIQAMLWGASFLFIILISLHLSVNLTRVQNSFQYLCTILVADDVRLWLQQ